MEADNGFSKLEASAALVPPQSGLLGELLARARTSKILDGDGFRSLGLSISLHLGWPRGQFASGRLALFQNSSSCLSVEESDAARSLRLLGRAVRETDVREALAHLESCDLEGPRSAAAKAREMLQLRPSMGVYGHIRPSTQRRNHYILVYAM